jgi:deoxyadenosine/deoxycytidine kinase
VPENYQSNPFWEAFYSNPSHYGFETELSFLLHHYHEIKKLHKSKETIICDYSFLIDMAYARIGLSGTKLQAFSSVYEEIIRDIPPPSLLVFLKCGSDIQMERVIKRGRPAEQSISMKFLDDLNRAVEKEISDYTADVKVISIDSVSHNFIDDKEAKKKILKQISSLL